MTIVTGALAVDMGARTISGLVTPYDRSAVSGSRRYRFLPGWARYSGIVRLLRDHDFAQRAGRALDLSDAAGGLAAVMFVERGCRGDRLLEETEAGGLGFSHRFIPELAEWRPDPDEPGVRLVVSAPLAEISLTARPAFGWR